MVKCLNDKHKPADRHRAVVQHGSGLLVVVAGPGTGKTYSLLRKIETLLDSRVDPREIYYLTFVNSIVEAFRDDIRKSKKDGGLAVDPDELGIHISTLHSLAFKLVKTYVDNLGLPSHLEVVDLSPRPSRTLAQVLVNDLYAICKCEGIVKDKRTFNRLLRELTDTWRRNVPPDGSLAGLEEATDRLCSRYCACPWDKLVQLAIKAIEDNGLPKWLQGAQHFMIDEYQDFNPAEQYLITLITEPSDSVVIVGDPDQSIYRGRSASPRGLQELLRRDDAQYVNFVYCRRCPRKVIESANNLLKYMDADGYENKRLQPFRDDQGTFLIEERKSCKAEVEYIASIISSEAKAGNSYILLLFPSNKAREFYSKKLSEAGIECTLTMVDVEGEIMSALLRLSLLESHPLLERLAITFFKKLDQHYVSEVLPEFASEKISVGEAFQRTSSEKNWSSKLKDELAAYDSALDELKSSEADSIVSGLSKLGITLSKDMVVTLLDTDSEMPARDRVEQALQLHADSAADELQESISVNLLTMHSAKGLSKPTVIIPAFEDKWLPGPKQGEELAEQHRLLYVAITRAEEKVFITYPRTRARKDPLNYPVQGAGLGLSTYAKILLPD